MKRNLVISWLVILGLALLVAGCGGKGSSLEGKVVDAAGKPIAGLKIIAKQTTPIKGYEQFEAVSGADGSFKFKGLYPSSQYVVEPWAQSWTTEAKLQVTAAPDGETLIVPQPLSIRQASYRQGGSLVIDPATGKPRYSASAGGVITDNNTGLEWVVGPDKGINYNNAEAWVKGCGIAGGGWRMPTLVELRGLRSEGLGDRNMDSAFKTTGGYVWATQKDSSAAWAFELGEGIEGSGSRDHDDGWGRVFGVRSAK